MSTGDKMNKSDYWTTERMEILRLRVLENVSYRDIGTEIGCSRNAAISKAKRLGFDKQKPSAWTKGSNMTGAKNTIGVKKREMVVGAMAQRLYAKRRALQNYRIARAAAEQRVFEAVEVKEENGLKWTNEVSTTMACWECFEADKMCHWPVQSDPHQFCGAPRMVDNNDVPIESYCERHYKLSLRKEERKR